MVSNTRVSIAKTGEMKGNAQFMAGEYVRYDEDAAAPIATLNKAMTARAENSIFCGSFLSM